MSLEPTFEEQQVLAETLRLNQAPLIARERRAAILISAGFFVAQAAIWLISPPHGLRLAAVAGCVLALLLSMAVEIETPFGYTAPTQIAFVPLLMAAPAALVGPIVLAVLVAARLPAVVRGESPAVRLLQIPANCWFAVGPAAVLAVAGTDPRHLGLVMLVAALGAQFAVDFAVSALRFSIAREASLSSQLRDAWVYLVDAGLSGVGWAVGLTQATRPLVGLAVIPLLALLFVLARERTKRLAATIELSNAYRGTALALGDVVAADDGYTGEHCRSVVVLAAAVGARLGLDSERARNLEFAALLHDVGKIAVPKEIVNKPGKLSPEEWTIIKTHTLEGQRMLDRVGGFMHEVGQIVRSHHERWDGAGYPDGLAGEAIPLEARIIACCDTWNAMRTDRSYRRALAYDVSLHELISNSGTQFDPRVVKTLVEIVREEEPTPSPRPAAEPDSAPAVLLP